VRRARKKKARRARARGRGHQSKSKSGRSTQNQHHTTTTTYVVNVLDTTMHRVVSGSRPAHTTTQRKAKQHHTPHHHYLRGESLGHNDAQSSLGIQALRGASYVHWIDVREEAQAPAAGLLMNSIVEHSRVEEKERMKKDEKRRGEGRRRAENKKEEVDENCIM
jgi:hypothetical protein